MTKLEICAIEDANPGQVNLYPEGSFYHGSPFVPSQKKNNYSNKVIHNEFKCIIIRFFFSY